MAIYALLSGSYAVAAAAETKATVPVNVAVLPRDAVKTASGLASVVLSPGQGKGRPQINDCVKLSFTAWAPDGAVFARSHGDYDVECVRRLTSGIAEAVQAMVAGERRRVWVPSRLNGTTEKSGSEAPRAPDLVYELTLVDVIKAPPTPTPLKAAPATAKKLPSGLGIKSLAKGTGQTHPSLSSKVTLHLSGWRANGALFESTLMSGQPAIYVVEQLLPGLREGVQQMVVGDRARFWLPATLAYGVKPRRRSQPAGAMVYDVELLAIE